MSSEKLAKAVAKRLQHYLETQRREEAFDPSGNHVPARIDPMQRSVSIGSYDDSPRSQASDAQSVKKKTPNTMKGGLDGLSEREKAIRKQIERSMMSQAQKKRNKSPYSVPLARARGGYMSAEEYPRTKRRRRRSGGLAVGRPPSVARRSPAQLVSKEERERILSIATKLIVATETVALPQNRRIAKGNQTESEQAFPHLDKRVGRRQSSASDPGPRNIPHPPLAPSRSSSGRGHSARSSPWGKSGWTDNLPSGSGTESHDDVQTQMQRLRIQERNDGNYILSPRSNDRPRSAAVNRRTTKNQEREARPRNRRHTLKTEAEIQTENKQQNNNNNNSDNNDYEDDFYDRSSTEVSPMSTPRNTWSPSASVQTHDMSTQTVVHTGTQTTPDSNGNGLFQDKVVMLGAGVIPKGNQFNLHEPTQPSKGPVTATIGTTTEDQSTTVDVQTQHIHDQATDTVVPVETQTRRRDLEPKVITYEVYVVTGDRLGASTTAEVKISVFGEYGNSGERALLRSKTNKSPFQRKQIDVFAVDSVYVGKLNSIRIGHNGTALGTGWYLDSVFVKEGPEATRAFEFSCGRWLSARDDDGQIIRDLPLARVIPAIDVPSSSGNQKERSYFNYRRLSTESNVTKRPSSGPPRPLRNGELHNSDSQGTHHRPGTARVQRTSSQSAGSTSNNDVDEPKASLPDRRLPRLQKVDSRTSRKDLEPLARSPSGTVSTSMKSAPKSSEHPYRDQGHSSEDESDHEAVPTEVHDERDHENADEDDTHDDSNDNSGLPEASADHAPEDNDVDVHHPSPPLSPIERKVSTSSSSSSSDSEAQSDEEENSDEDKDQEKEKDATEREPELELDNEEPKKSDSEPDFSENVESHSREEEQPVDVPVQNNDVPTLTNGAEEHEEKVTETPRTARSDSSDDEKIEFSNKDTSKKEATSEEEYLAGFKAGLKASQEEKEHDREKRSPTPPITAGDTIHHACEVGDTNKVKQMIMASPELKNQLDERGWGPIHVTASKGHLDLMKWLSVSGVDLMKETPTGYTPMHVAAMNGHVNCIMILAAMGCSLSCRTVDKFTPLHLSAMSGHMECVKWLLANRAKTDVLDIHGRTPYDLADEYQHEECAKLLSSMKKELKKKDSIINLLRNPVHPPSPQPGDNLGEDDDNESWVSDTEDNASAAESRPSSGRPDSRKASRQEKLAEEKEEKRRLYQQQREKLKKRGSSFLDSVRMDVDGSVDDDF